jgi:hypothetical protein
LEIDGTYTLLPVYPVERGICAHRLGGWMDHRGGLKFGRKAKILLVTNIETQNSGTYNKYCTFS